jgi:hypothetical protein
MRNAKQTHVVKVTGPLIDLDLPASILALMSRGRNTLTGPSPEREELAALLDGTALAPALLDGRPLVVTAVNNGYRFEEV